MLLLDGKSMEVYAFMNELNAYWIEVLLEIEDLMQAIEHNNSTKFYEILNSTEIAIPENLNWDELRTAFLAFFWQFQNDNQIDFFTEENSSRDMTEEDEIEDLKSELAANKEKLADSIDDLEQAIETGNEHSFRSILTKFGIWVSKQLSWEGLKKAFLALLPS